MRALCHVHQYSTTKEATNCNTTTSSRPQTTHTLRWAFVQQGKNKSRSQQPKRCAVRRVLSIAQEHFPDLPYDCRYPFLRFDRLVWTSLLALSLVAACLSVSSTASGDGFERIDASLRRQQNMPTFESHVRGVSDQRDTPF